MFIILQKYKCEQFVSCLLVATLLVLTVQVTPLLWSQQLVWLEYIAMGGCLLMAISSLYLRANCQLAVVDILVTVWWGYVLLRAYLQANYPCSYEVTVNTVLYVLYVLLRFFFSVAPLRDDILEHLIMFAAFFEVGMGIWQFFMGGSLHHLYPITGSFYNPGPYAAYVAIGMSVALVQLSELKSEAKYYVCRKGFLLLLLVLGMLVLMVAGSRGALVSLLVVASWKYGKFVRKYLCYLVIVGIGLGFVLLYVKFGSAMGRLVIWCISGRLIFDNGLFGAGIGGFKGEYGNALFRYFSHSDYADSFACYADVTDFAFCDLLQMGVEQGWIGILLCLLIVTFAMKGWWKNAHGLFAGMLALLVFSLFSYPFQLLPFQILGIILLAKTPNIQVVSLRVSWQMALVLSFVISIFSWQVANFTRKYVDASKASHIATMSIHSAYINDCYSLLEYCREDKNFLFKFAKMLQIDGRYIDSNSILMRGVKVSNDPMFWVLMGNNLKSMMLYDDAVVCYDRASGMLPNRLYPIYQKMKLYLEIGKAQQAKRSARLLMTRKPKVQSSATRRMFDEAYETLSQ